jgi:hypothetical protein
MRLSEDQLCHAFADAVKHDPQFAAWLLRQTKFADLADDANVLHDEQMSVRPRKHWWRHWWCSFPGMTKARETDIFVVFEARMLRFALHIENKRDTYRFSEGQAADYAPRAKHMMGKSDFLNHTDFATVLLAPRSFRRRFEADCALFDTFISYEDVAHHLPQFETALH